MSIDIRPIKILFDTNIPGKQVVPFTKSLLYNPELKDISGLDEYPNFTMDVLFPFSYLNSLSYENQVKFFFNKSEMVKVLKIYKPVVFNDSSNIDEMPEILTIGDQEIIKKENDEARRKKERIVELKELIQKKGTEIKKYEQESKLSKKFIEINENIKKKTDEKEKKEKEYETYLQTISPESIKTRLDEIFKPADPKVEMTEPPASNINFYTTFFEGKKKRSDVQKEALTYIEKINSILVNLEKIFLTYSNETEEDKYKDILSEINKLDIQSNKRPNRVDIDLWNLYTFIKKLPNEIQELTKLLKSYIEQHLLDKENEELQILEKEKSEEENKIKEYTQKLKDEEANLTNEKATLDKGLIENTNTKSNVTSDEINNQKIAKAKFQTKNGDENVLMMLQLLFPTKYPIIGNTFSSFNSLILQKSDFNMRFRDFLPSFLKNKLIEGTSAYSYVKIDGKVYTVSQAVWLNDIYNHKEYADLIDKFKKLKIWKDKANSKLSDEITTKLNKFKSNYANGFDTADISYIKSQNKNINDLSNIATGYAKEKLQAEYATYNSTLDDFINTVNIFQSSIDNESYDTISDNAKNMVETYKLVTKYGTNFFKPKDKFNKIIENVNRDLEEIRINEYIRDKYMSKPGIDLDYEKDDPKYSSRLKTNFKEYTEFVDNIKKFRAPNKESSNYHLQETFNEFLENREKYKGIFNFLMNPYNININPFDKIKKRESAEGVKSFTDAKENYHKRKNTGVTILPSAGSTEPGYEIYVQLNVIGGELNDTNKSLVDCLYQGESLGNKMEYLINESLRNPWDINTTRLFFDITEGDAVKEIEKKKIENQTNQSEKVIEKMEEKKGGNIKYNMNTRKLRSNIIKTYKKRF
jgi:hypothetical protein